MNESISNTEITHEKYVTDFVCTYQLLCDDEDDDEADDLYRTQFIQAFCMIYMVRERNSRGLSCEIARTVSSTTMTRTRHL